jgi:peptidoglycan/xylan/chitin deacetylase (PgdA/CDA1 family)
MHYDRHITLGIVRPLRRILKLESQNNTLTILMYHSISDAREDHLPPYYRTGTHPLVFALHMAWLREHKIRGVSLRDGLENTSPASFSGEKKVVLTFDDGFADFMTAAYPILLEHGFGATVFLATAFIGNQPRHFNTRECLTWNHIRELHRGGIEFGSHTVNHPQLHGLDRTRIRAELHSSKVMIEQEIGSTVFSFSYPYAFPSGDPSFARDLGIMLGEADYGSEVTTEVGRNHPGFNPYRLKRLPMNSCDDNALFAAKLEGAYDWFGHAQGVSKRCRQFATRNRHDALPP